MNREGEGWNVSKVIVRYYEVRNISSFCRSSGGNGTGFPAKLMLTVVIRASVAGLAAVRKKDLLMKLHAAAFEAGNAGIDVDQIIVAHGLAIVTLCLHHGQMYLPGYQFRIAEAQIPQEGFPGQFKKMKIIAMVHGLTHINFIQRDSM